ncbi:MAG: spondin domain-containing protein [Thalassotalea sp.]
MKFKSVSILASMAAALSVTNAFAQDLEITIQNLTQGMTYTPFIVAAHDADTRLFQLGGQASAELKAMAEGGSISGLSAVLTAANADIVENPAGGPLAPAMSTTTMLMTDASNMYLSLAAMLLPTNDGFAALNGWKIPQEVGTYTVYINAYDAGTEANNELVSADGGAALGIPAAPFVVATTGTNGTGITTEEANQYVHIHRGAMGDDDDMGGKSDLDNTVHRWLNPVAKVTVIVK